MLRWCVGRNPQFAARFENSIVLQKKILNQKKFTKFICLFVSSVIINKLLWQMLLWQLWVCYYDKLIFIWLLYSVSGMPLFTFKEITTIISSDKFCLYYYISSFSMFLIIRHQIGNKGVANSQNHLSLTCCAIWISYFQNVNIYLPFSAKAMRTNMYLPAKIISIFAGRDIFIITCCCELCHRIISVWRSRV